MNDRSSETSPDSTRVGAWTRRDLLGQGCAALVGVAFVGVSIRPARSQSTKVAKSAVQYVDHYGVEGKDCDDCVQFISGPRRGGPGTCKIVDGAISPHGHCIAFVPKT